MQRIHRISVSQFLCRACQNNVLANEPIEFTGLGWVHEKCQPPVAYLGKCSYWPDNDKARVEV
jgi:hypothetical protein